jgi:hypothetical protein
MPASFLAMAVAAAVDVREILHCPFQDALSVGEISNSGRACGCSKLKL